MKRPLSPLRIRQHAAVLSEYLRDSRNRGSDYWMRERDFTNSDRARILTALADIEQESLEDAIHADSAQSGRLALPKPAKRVRSPRKISDKRPMSKAKLNSLRKRLKAKAWRLFSVWVRSKDADHAGMVKCYTCDSVKPWREMHAGHWAHRKLDLDPRNVHVQCNACNCYRRGKLNVYTLRLIEELGSVGAVEQLSKEAEQHQGYTIEELEAAIAKYSEAK